MTRPARALFGLVLLVAVGCSARVVREGTGWRETESKEPGKTTVEVTTSDPKVLAELAKTAPDARVRGEAQSKISDPSSLADIIAVEKEAPLRKRMVERLTDEALLRQLAQNDSDEGIKQAASSRADLLKTVDPKHPEFNGWTCCRPGTWVRWKVEVKTNGERSSVEMVRTLLECCPERVVLEQKVASTGRPLQGIPRDFLTRFDVAYGRKVEDEGDLQLQGRTMKCKWVRHHFQRGGDIAQVRRWMNSDIPGGVARIDMEVSPEGQPLSSLTAVAVSWERK